MTSPEWEAANEDDSDRFPQPSPHEAPPPVVDPLQSDPARVARYAEAQCVMVGGRLATTAYDAARFRISELETPMGWRLGDVIARLVLDSGAVAVADEEHAALVAEVERLRAGTTNFGDGWRLVKSLRARAEAAEAKVAKVEALADKWGAESSKTAVGIIKHGCATELRAALADAPAEQRAQGGA